MGKKIIGAGAKYVGQKISDVLKKIKKNKTERKAKKAQESAGLGTKAIKPFNYRAGARNEQIVPVKKQSQKGSSFQPHRIAGKQSSASIRASSEGSAASWRDEMERMYGDIKISEFFKKSTGGDINTGMKKLSEKQKKIARMAPPRNKITGADFKAMKAKYGKMIKAEKGKYLKPDPTKAINSVPPKITSGSLHKNLMKGKNPYSDLVKTTNKGPGRYSSMAEMREAKGFKPGETASQFNKRRMALEAGKKAIKASKYGKAAAAIVGIGLAAKAYLKNKMNKDEKPKGKMYGGSVKKYSEGMSYNDMKPYGGSYVKKKAEMKASQTENVKKLTTSDDAYSPETMFVVTRGTKRDSRSRPTMIRKTTDLNARQQADKMNARGTNTESFATYKLPPAYQRDYLRQQQRNKMKSIGRTVGMTSRKADPRRRSRHPSMQKVPMYSKGGDLRSDYIDRQTRLNEKATGKKNYIAESKKTRREEYGAAKDRYPTKTDKLRGIAKRVGSLAPFMPTVSVAKGVYDKLSQSSANKYSKGTMVKARGCKLGKTRPTKIT